ncbi:MAG: nucleotidyltransferase domain-containing protein [Pirellulales bacterium]
MDEHREKLLAVKRGELAWEETERWRIALHREFERAVESTTLPERPDYERANVFLIKGRRAALMETLP